MRAGRTALQLVLPRHLRPRRQKIFGAAPSHRLDPNAKARLWAAAAAYNSANRRPHQHQGPLTLATLRVLRALIWRFQAPMAAAAASRATSRSLHSQNVTEIVSAWRSQRWSKRGF